MCGRFVLTLDYHTLINILKGRYDLENLPPSHDYEPRYNIAPSNKVLSLIGHKDKVRAGYLKWGFIPPWAQDEKSSYTMINARSESLDVKPAYKKAFTHGRCVILADGFYEWRREGRRKTPIFVTVENRSLFAIAGLYSIYHTPDGGKISTCTIITTHANAMMSSIHDRMPVILNRASEKRWLDPSITDTHVLKELLTPYSSDHMMAYQVSSLVNATNYDAPSCIEPFQGTLF